MSWLWGPDELDELKQVEPARASGKTLHVAVLALKYETAGDSLSWAWACNADKKLALGHALEVTSREATVVNWLVIEIPLASGTEAGTAETAGLGPKDDGPVAATSGETPDLNPNPSNTQEHKGDTL